MTDEERAPIRAAIALLPKPHDFAAGYGLKREMDEEGPPPGDLPGVLLRWPDTAEGRAAAGLFAAELWARS
jgi:hypothetical protein